MMRFDMKQIPVQAIAMVETIKVSFDDLINMKWFVFKGWKNLSKIQGDKSVDFAVVFFQDQEIKHMPDLKKMNSPKIIAFYGMRGNEQFVFEQIKKNMQSSF